MLRWLVVDAALGLGQVFVAIPIIMYRSAGDMSSPQGPTMEGRRLHVHGWTELLEQVEYLVENVEHGLLTAL